MVKTLETSLCRKKKKEVQIMTDDKPKSQSVQWRGHKTVNEETPGIVFIYSLRTNVSE